MVLYDRTIGSALHAVNTIAVVYYIAWIGVSPFVDAAHFTQRLFPPREYGLVLPAAVVVLFFAVSLTVAAGHLWFATPEELRGLGVVAAEPAGTPAPVHEGPGPGPLTGTDSAIPPVAEQRPVG